MSSDSSEEQSDSLSGEEPTQATVQIPFPESFIYANAAAFSISLTEFRIGFAEIMQNHQAVARVGIVMPPETAAVVALFLSQQIKTYEKNFGEIRHPLWKAAKKRLAQTPNLDSKDK